MVEELLPGLYRIEVPLPKNPLRATNSYVIRGKERSLVVDTGLNLPVSAEVWQAGITEIGLRPEDMDFFITHSHSDHVALTATVASASSTIFIGELDLPTVVRSADPDQRAEFWRSVSDRLGRNGFPPERLKEALARHPGFLAGLKQALEFTLRHDGDTIEVGDYQFECVWTPGHSIGHLCLYDRAKKLLLSGDHVLGDITPTIGGAAGGANPLGNYLESLTKIGKLNIERMLPGHRRVIMEPQRRIEELKHHHQLRLAEVLDILEKGPQTAYEVAGRMTWDIKYDNWEEFPVQQQWFAAGEALSHLIYLEHSGLASQEERAGQFYFALNK